VPWPNRDPYVSVIMPTYNAERTLEAAMRSVLAQTLEDLELIVVLNGITDASTDIARAVATDDARVRLIERREAGYNAALREAAQAAEGVLVAVLDADDVAHADRLAAQSAFLEARPDVGLVGSWARRIDMDGRPLELARMPTRAQGLMDLLQHECLMYHPTVMVRREALEQVGGYSIGFECAPDFDLYLKLLEAGIAIDNIPTALIDYRVVPTGITQSRGAAQRQEAELAVARSRLRSVGVTADALDAAGTSPLDLLPLIPAGELPGLRLRLTGFDGDGIAALDRDELDAAYRQALPAFARSQRDADLSLLAYRMAVAFRHQLRIGRSLGWYARSYRADPRLFRVLVARTVRSVLSPLEA
jgi:glycosyltransferase involved in cell wall biosynthesis